MVRYTLYVPEKDNDGDDLIELNSEVINRLCAHFGGCTVIKSSGYWRDTSSGMVYADYVNLMYADVDNDGEPRQDNLNFIAHLAKYVLDEANQESVKYDIQSCLGLETFYI